MKEVIFKCDLCHDQITPNNFGFSISFDVDFWLTFQRYDELSNDRHICLNCAKSIKKAMEVE